MADVAVARERQAVVQRLRGCVLLGLEARQERPANGEDPKHADHPGADAEGDDCSATLADAQPRPPTRTTDQALSSSFSRPESSRRANVAMMIEKTTTTIA